MAKPTLFQTFIDSRSGHTEDLVSCIATGESKRFGGYLNNFSGNKGMRGGLLEGKTAIRQTSPYYLKKASCLALEKEKSFFISDIRNTIFEELDDIVPKGIWHRITQRKRANSLQQIRSGIEAKTDELIADIEMAKAKSSRLIFDVLKERQLFTSKVKDELSPHLLLNDDTVDKTLKHTLHNIQVELDAMYREFEKHTFVELEYCEETFLKNCINAVKSEEWKYQRLPGDDGLYEIVGLKGVASRLEYLLKQIQTESESPTSDQAQHS